MNVSDTPSGSYVTIPTNAPGVSKSFITAAFPNMIGMSEHRYKERLGDEESSSSNSKNLENHEPNNNREICRGPVDPNGAVDNGNSIEPLPQLFESFVNMLPFMLSTEEEIDNILDKNFVSAPD